MIVAIHQPEHIPWLGFFHKLNKADIYVILDNVQFRKNYFQNRNKIRTAEGWSWITVPTKRSSSATLIKDIGITLDSKWKKKWLDSVYFSYKKSSYFDCYFQELNDVLSKTWDNLSDLNICLLVLLCKLLGLDSKFIRSSQLPIKGKGSKLLLSICKELKADIYLSGISGHEYLKLDDFKKENIKVIFQEFHHPLYKQIYEPFIPCMSVIDLLFNYGENSLGVINGKDVPVMEGLFL